MKRGKIKKYDVLVVKDGATTGKTSFVSDSFPFKEAAVNEHVFILRTNDRVALPKYLFFWMLSPFGQNSVKDNFQGTAQGGINILFVKNSIIPIPPLSEQHRIVAKIEELFTKLDAGVEALKKAKEQIKRYRQAVLKYAFEGKLTEEWRKSFELLMLNDELKETQNPQLNIQNSTFKTENSTFNTQNSKLPKGWVWVRLGEISDDIQYGYTAKAINEPLGPKMLRITDIQENNVDWNNVPYCVIEPDKEKKYLLNEGDLVFARTGATVGKSFLIKGKIPKSIFASYLIRIVLSKNVLKEYVYNFFQSYEYWKQIISNQLGIGQPNVNSQILSKIILPLPPLAEQQQIVEEIERRFSVADEVEKAIDNSLKQAERLRQSILKKAFEGKLVPQDPNAEPADKLLERVRKSLEL
jgi:type I restriction enzyme S subunit